MKKRELLARIVELERRVNDLERMAHYHPSTSATYPTAHDPYWWYLPTVTSDDIKTIETKA